MNRKDLFTKFLEELGIKFVIADAPGRDPTQDFVLLDVTLPGGYICVDVYEDEIEVHGAESKTWNFHLCDPTSLDKVKDVILKGELTPYPGNDKMSEESGRESHE